MTQTQCPPLDYLAQLIAERLAPDAPRPTAATMLEHLPLDSLDWVEVTMDAEEAYEVGLRDGEVALCATLGDLAGLVDAALKAAFGAAPDAAIGGAAR